MTALNKIQKFFLEDPMYVGAQIYNADDIIRKMNSSQQPAFQLKEQSTSKFEKMIGNVFYSDRRIS